MTCEPPKGTEPETLHLLTYTGADKPKAFLWRNGMWNSPGTGWGTKPKKMAVLGWRYVGPVPEATN